jgi:hypothetical protein
MSVHYKTYTSTSTSNSIASRLYGVQVSGDDTPGATTNSADVKVNGVDLIAEDLPPTLDSGVAGAPMTYWFNIANPSAGIPVSSFDITIAGTCSVVLLFEPA